MFVSSMDPAQGGQPSDYLSGDQGEVVFIDAEGVLKCSPHHDDWEGLEWPEAKAWGGPLLQRCPLRHDPSLY